PGARAAAHDEREARSELAIARQDIVQIAEQEAVAPHRFEQKMQQKPQILDAGVAPFRRRQQAVEPALEAGEELGDDLVLVAKMIVEIAGTDLHLVGNIRSRDIRLADAVEQQQRGLENAFPRSPRAFALRHGCAPASVKPAVYDPR